MGIAKMKVLRTVWIVLSFLVATAVLSSCSTEQVVYVCTGPQAYAYHEDSDCYLMASHCTGSIKEITISKAKRMNRKPCGKCSNK